MNQISHANKFKVGDTIRAYEFEPMAGRNDCYHEGKVVEENNREHGYNGYLIEVTRHVFDGQPAYFGAGLKVIVPHVISFREYAHRVLPV